ncbi:hypothetical protein [Leptospira interrogans]|uniref:hypothetical protein n=1 Tax=Leptospira interrogans TaxID=173 RepID=UPI0002BA6179|nr:hypothetical protein [Leptospira interrogans]MCR8646524.1 hypothetical protein [Leptospira interrogans serovar Bataviae]OAM85668.1 hypothetical protein A1343_02820 [Leptospira interrogans serovar Bataviae]QOI39612.1 hypothetical protein Lepto1548_15955 [Leptospira interrogans serovar Bataviae]QYY59876.1 hypothetical protein GR153_014800 [Leptospira interrogans serovar Bataviae]
MSKIPSLNADLSQNLQSLSILYIRTHNRFDFLSKIIETIFILSQFYFRKLIKLKMMNLTQNYRIETEVFALK